MIGCEGPPIVDANFDTLRLMVIEAHSGALQDIVAGPCHVRLDPEERRPDPADHLSQVDVLEVFEVVRVEARVKSDLVVDCVCLSARPVLVGVGHRESRHIAHRLGPEHEGLRDYIHDQEMLVAKLVE